MTNDIAAAIKHVEMAVAFELGEGNHLTALFCYQSAALDHPRLPNIRIRDLASPDGEPDVVPSDSSSTGNIFTWAASTSKNSEIQKRSDQPTGGDSVRRPTIDRPLDTPPCQGKRRRRHRRTLGAVGTKLYIRIKPGMKWTRGIDEPAIRDGKSNVKRYKL